MDSLIIKCTKPLFAEKLILALKEKFNVEAYLRIQPGMYPTAVCVDTLKSDISVTTLATIQIWADGFFQALEDSATVGDDVNSLTDHKGDPLYPASGQR